MRLEWVRARAVLRLSLPITIALVVQNAMSLVTMAMVGRLGNTSLAGLAVAATLYGIPLAILFGIDAGVQAVVARRIGAGDLAGAGATLNDALVLAFGAGLVLAGACYTVGPVLLHLMLGGTVLTALGGTGTSASG